MCVPKQQQREVEIRGTHEKEKKLPVASRTVNGCGSATIAQPQHNTPPAGC